MHGREGEEAKSQLFAFTGRKLQNKKDDFPDALINFVFEMLQRHKQPFSFNEGLYKKYKNAMVQ
ncbi:MAG: hypothetical protein LBO69_03555 [Ignavibacteria bacterium]|jgi:hypothetical protein|nr:hypothetical protein [Ignavibacteria bacterium]